MPRFIVDDNGTPVCQPFQTIYNLIGLFGHGLVQVLAGLIVLVDLVGFLQCCRKVLFYKQFYRFFSVLDASGRVDARAYLEYDIAYGDFFF